MKTIFISLLLILTVPLVAQQIATSSFSDMYPLLHNPATAGSDKSKSLGATFRKQWESIPGAPQTAMVFGNTLFEKAKLGISGYLYNDVTGPTRRTGLQMSYAYHIALAEVSQLSFGLAGRIQQFSIDAMRLQEGLDSDPTLSGNQKKIKGDAGFGIAYENKKLQIGTSVSQLVQSKIALYEKAGTAKEQAKLYRHYYLHGRYNWQVDEATVITPHFLITYLPNAPTELQAGIKVEHNQTFWYGAGLRARQSWMVSAGLRVKQQFGIGYAFDIYNAPLSIYSKGGNAHELALRYQLK